MGVGLGAYVEICGFGPWESATVRVEPSGKVTGLHRHLAARPGHRDHAWPRSSPTTLGVGIDDIIVHPRRHRHVPTGIGTFGSRGVVRAAARC